MTNILIFDKPKKCELFAKYFGKTTANKLIYTFDPDDAIKKIKYNKPDIVVLGGDVDTEALNAVRLYHMMEELQLHKKRTIYISTWNVEEARILRDMSRKSFYCPFSETLAALVKERAKQKRTAKRRKNLQKD